MPSLSLLWGEWVWLPYLEGLLRFNERIHEEQGREGQVPSAGRVGDSAGETRGRDWVRFSGPLLLSWSPGPWGSQNGWRE